LKKSLEKKGSGGLRRGTKRKGQKQKANDGEKTPAAPPEKLAKKRKVDSPDRMKKANFDRSEKKKKGKQQGQ